MQAHSIYRVMSPEIGPDSQGPPFTTATGLGWDTSTEPKNKADMVQLAKKLNPILGFWGALFPRCALHLVCAHSSVQHAHAHARTRTLRPTADPLGIIKEDTAPETIGW